MTNHRFILAAPLLWWALLAGCHTATLYNPRVTFAPQDEQKVEDAILKGLEHQAVARRPWIYRIEKPGVITGILNLRVHQAVVRIEYDRSSYSIRLLDSKELLYAREANGEEIIHENYNAWITALVNDINAYLGIYGTGDGGNQPAKPGPGT